MSAFDRLVALKQRGSLIESALSVYLMDRVPSYLPGLPSTRKKAVPSSLLRNLFKAGTNCLPKEFILLNGPKRKEILVHNRNKSIYTSPNTIS